VGIHKAIPDMKEYPELICLKCGKKIYYTGDGYKHIPKIKGKEAIGQKRRKKNGK